mgnify:FL=1
MKTYTTVQGDMWDSIALRELGSEKYTNLLIEANIEYHDIFVFSSGIVLTIPDVDETTEADSLPPWKRVSG